MVFLGTDEDGNTVFLESVNEATYLVHVVGNTMSPFEFSTEDEARIFADFLSHFRMENRLEEMLDA
jgi:hypothetical protein